MPSHGGEDALPENELGEAASADDHFVFGYDLDGALGCDVDDAAAHHLPVGQLDEDLVTRAPSGFGLVHEGQDGAPTHRGRAVGAQRDRMWRSLGC